MKQMIGYCGLNCERCDAYLATVRDDWQLRKKNGQTVGRAGSCPDPSGTYQLSGMSGGWRENGILRKHVRHSSVCMQKRRGHLRGVPKAGGVFDRRDDPGE